MSICINIRDEGEESYPGARKSFARCCSPCDVLRIVSIVRSQLDSRQHTRTVTLAEVFSRPASDGIERYVFVQLARAWVDSDQSSHSNLDRTSQHSVEAEDTLSHATG